MQSFVPLYTFSSCAKVLDDKRCFKNALEAYQVLRVIRGLSRGGGWKNHPVVKMWNKQPNTYVDYALAFVAEWKARGYNTTLEEKIKALYVAGEANSLPQWWGNEAVHLSHRSNLIRKMPDYYGDLWPNDPDNLPYVWPIS